MNPMDTLITVHTDAGPLQLPAPATLADAVAALIAKRSAGEAETHIRALATAVNGHFVPRDARQTHLLQEGDQVLCFSPITGG
jgi:sulfur carrier protein